MFIYEHKNWPDFQWNEGRVAALLAAVRFRQGKLLGNMQSLGFSLREEAMLQTITLDVTKSSEIEGELLDQNQVRSLIARRLGIHIAGSVHVDRNVEGVVEMMLDATQNFQQDLSDARLFRWLAALFPTGRTGMYPINVDGWRKDETGPMQVVSGAMGRERVHYQAPAAGVLVNEMNIFLTWFNMYDTVDPVIKAALAHLWFVTIHPFEDGNGRIARAIADMQLARADETSQRFYSMSSQIRKERNGYYDMLEKTQRGGLDITDWLEWFLECLERALLSTEDILSIVLQKAKFWERNNQLALNARQQLMLNKLLDGIDEKLTSSKWAKMAKCSQDTAGRDIQDLVEKGVLIKEDGGGRSTSYGLNY